MTKQRQELVPALLTILDYSFDDELYHFIDCLQDDGVCPGHIFRALCTVRNYLDGTALPAEYYAAQSLGLPAADGATPEELLQAVKAELASRSTPA